MKIHVDVSILKKLKGPSFEVDIRGYIRIYPWPYPYPELSRVFIRITTGPTHASPYAKLWRHQ